MEVNSNRKFKRLSAIVVALMMVVGLLPGMAFAAEAYGAQGGSGNELTMLSPDASEIYVKENTVSHAWNVINSKFTEEEELTFTFTMSAGMNNTSTEKFLQNNSGNIKIYDAYKDDNAPGNILAQYNNEADQAKLKVEVDSSTKKVFLSVDKKALSAGKYYLVFDAALCGNKTSKKLGKPVFFEFEIEAPVSSISLDKTEISLNLYSDDKNTFSLKANILPENATKKDIIWTSSDNAVATVDAAGNVRAISEGTATITATTVDGNKTASCEVTVTAECKHALQEIAAKAATCEVAGNEAYYECKTCGKLFSNAAATTEIIEEDIVIPAISHKDAKKIEAKEATCDNAGNKAYYECTACNKLFADNTCTKETTIAEVKIPATNHNGAKKIEAKAATCEADGNKAYYECTACNKLFTDDTCTKETTIDEVKIPAIAHKGAKKVEAKEATCEAAGNEAYYECKACNNLFTDNTFTKTTTKDKVVIPAKGHTIQAVSANAETCEADGNIEYYECTVCNNFFNDLAAKNEITKESVVIKAKGHTFTSDVYKFNETGHWHEGLCTVCGDPDTVAAHQLIEVIDKQATTTETGLKHKECKICDYVTAQEEIPVITASADQNQDKGGNGDASAQTGDDMNLMVWFALMLVALGGVSVVIATKKRRQ